MRALIFEEPWKMTLQNLPRPALEAGEVLIKMEIRWNLWQ